jgi:hypothetical protein
MRIVDLRSPQEQHELLDQVVNSDADHSDEKESRTGKLTEGQSPEVTNYGQLRR